MLALLIFRSFPGAAVPVPLAGALAVAPAGGRGEMWEMMPLIRLVRKLLLKKL